MKKILYLRSSFDFGGTESLLLNLFNTPQKEIQFHYVFLKEGCLISRLHSATNKYYKIFRKRKIDIAVLRKISQILIDESIKIVHTHQMYELFYACLLKIRYPRLKIFHTIHGYFENKNKWAPFIEKILILFTRATFTVSYAAKSVLSEKGYPVYKIDVLYNAVSKPPVANKKDLDEFKRKINYQPDDFIVGMIGNFVWQKDQITIIKATNLLKARLPGLKFVFIGKESSMTEKCKELLEPSVIGKNVFFLGPIEDAAKFLKVFNLFIMSTLQDTFGIAVVEALLQKVPVIASDVGIMKELSHTGKYFELFKSQNPESLADKICNIHYQKDDSIINDAYHHCISFFSYDRYIKELVSRYNL